MGSDGKIMLDDALSTVEDYANRPSDLPEDLQMQIISKMELKAIGRCKCVCKPWNARIGSPSFSAKEMEGSSRKPYMLVTNFGSPQLRMHLVSETVEDSVPILFTNNMSSDTSNWFMRGCCNGIVCLSCGWGWVDGGIEIALWNPVTTEAKLLPHSFYCEHEKENFTDKVMIERQALGIGFDEKEKDLKVVSVQGCFELKHANCNELKSQFPFKYEIEIYRLKTNSWERIKAGELIKESPHYGGFGVCTDSIISWFVQDRKQLISFDMIKEQVILTPLPLDISGDHLFSHKSSLHVVNKDTSNQFHIWKLDKFGDGEWTKLHTIGGNFMMVHGVCKTGIIIESNAHQLFLLDPQTGAEKFILDVEGWLIQVNEFKKTLVGLKR